MKQLALRFLQFVLGEGAKYHWHGWEHNTCRSREFKITPGNAQFTNALRTVFPESLIEVTISLRWIMPWRDKSVPLDPENHFYWYQVQVKDPFARYGKKMICNVLIDKEDEDIGIVNQAFSTLQESAIIHTHEMQIAGQAAFQKLMADLS
jgi:hypothetical protein